jgi:hypothetical protein
VEFRWRVVRQQVGVTSLAALQADDPQRVGPYLLLGRLGSGGMGRVYLARSPGGRQVAVKVIRPQLAEDDSFRARFAREVSAARKVGGLFTAQVVDADLDSPVPWLVTAYVPGASLTEAVEEQGPLPATTVLALAAGLAEGLNAIHAAGVIHRDLKPSNVLLAPDGPRIIDFGISSAADAPSLTGTGLMIGSPRFMSPEQAEGMPVGPSSDIFSLAGVLIFAARGEGPFGSGDTAALLYRVVHGTPNLDQVPDKIRPLISRCLSRSAAARPTAAEFLAELTAAYPAAADLADWLPARLVELSAQRVAEVNPHAGVAADAEPAGRAAQAETGQAAAADAGQAAAEAPRAAAEAPRPAAFAGLAGLAGSGATPAPPPTAKSPIPPPTQGVSQGLPGAQAYPVPRGYLGQAGAGGQGEAGADAGGQRGTGADGPQDTPGWRAWQAGGGAQQAGAGAQAGGGAQVPPSPMPYPTQPTYGSQPPYPGSQWYSPLMQQQPRRRRARWPWAVGAVAAVCAVIVTAVVLSLGSGHPATAAGSSATARPSSAAPSATPTVGNLQLAQLRVGDCLTGANMELNTSDPWPKVALAVPCNQPHTAEVFLADNSFWPQNSPFPGASTISKDGNAACNSAFRSYVGIAYSKSIYTWTNIIPDAPTWPTGDRALHCVAYYSTAQQRAGATLTRSLKGSRK